MQNTWYWHLFALTILFFSPFKSSYTTSDSYSSQIQKIFTESNNPALQGLWDECKIHLEKEMDRFEKCMAEQYTLLVDNHPEIAAQVLKTGIVDKIKSISEPKMERWQEVTPEMPEKNIDADFQQLGDYYGKKMDQIIYGEKPDQHNKLNTDVRPELFHKIHISQVSKNIIETISSYCIEADANNLHLIPKAEKDREKVKATNIRDTSIFDTNPKDNSKTNIASKNWKNCTFALSKICYQQEPYDDLKNEISTSDSTEKKKQKEDYQYSASRACQAIAYIKKQRESIIATGNDLKWLEAYAKESPEEQGRTIAFDSSKKEEPRTTYSGKESGKTVDDITSMASGELITESKFQASNDKIIEELEMCLKNVDEPFCKKYFSENLQKETKEKVELLKNAAVEYALKAKMKEEEVEKIKDNEERLENFLVSEGRDRAKAKEIIKQQTPAKVASTIKNEIQKERQSIFSIFKEKLSQLLDLEKQQRPEQALAAQLKQEKALTVEQQAQLMHYNNIISGYLELTQENPQGAQGMMNIKALSRELANSFYDDKRNEKFQQQHTVDSGHLEKIKEGAKTQMEKQGDNPNDQIQLQVETINSVIGRDYDQIKKEQKETATPAPK